jgi:predicted ester cyclase
LAAAAAVVGAGLGFAGILSIILGGIGLLPGWFILVSYVLTTLSLAGAYALVNSKRSYPKAAVALVVLAVLLVASVFVHGWASSFAPGDPSRLRGIAIWAAYLVRPLAALASGLATIALGDRATKRVAFLLLALGVLGAAPYLVYAFLPSWYSSSVSGWLLMGVPWMGIGLLEAVGWVLYGYTILRSGREVLTRELGEENLRKARRLYEEGFGRGDLAVVDEVASEDFRDLRHGYRGKQGMRRIVLALRESFPDLVVSVVEQDAEGELVRTRLLLSGTDRGGVLWFAPTGRRVVFSAEFVDRFWGSQLVEHSGSTDSEGLLRQLGASS